jgi:hypothetical protein
MQPQLIDMTPSRRLLDRPFYLPCIGENYLAKNINTASKRSVSLPYAFHSNMAHPQCQPCALTLRWNPQTGIIFIHRNDDALQHLIWDDVPVYAARHAFSRGQCTGLLKYIHFSHFNPRRTALIHSDMLMDTSGDNTYSKGRWGKEACERVLRVLYEKGNRHEIEKIIGADCHVEITYLKTGLDFVVQRENSCEILTVDAIHDKDGIKEYAAVEFAERTKKEVDAWAEVNA